MPVNPGNVRQKYDPADSVSVLVAEPPIDLDEINRLPNADAAFGAFGWTTELAGHVLLTDDLTIDTRLLPPAQRAAYGSPITGNITIVDATTIQVDPAATAAVLGYPDGMTDVDSPRYQARIDRVPALVDIGGQPILWNVKTTPAVGAPGTTPWVLEAATGGVALTPGTVVPPSNAYFLNYGSHFVVQFHQIDSAETNVGTNVRSARMGCVPGQVIRTNLQLLGQPIRLDTGATITTGTRQIWFNYYKADGTYLSQQVAATTAIAAGVTTVEYGPGGGSPVPAGAAYVTLNLRFVWPSDVPGVTVEMRFARPLVQLGVAPSLVEEFPVMRNIWPTSSQLELGRVAMDSSDVKLITSDPTYDPATSTLIRKGARVEINADLNGNGFNLERMFTGAVDTIEAEYPKHKGKPAPVITITFTDGMADLAATPRSAGYADLENLPLVLEGSIVPWNVTGQTGQSAYNGVPDWTNDNASALDQAAIARDTNHGYAYLDRFGVFNAHTENDGAGTIYAYTREFYVDEANFGTTAVPFLAIDDLINTITITALRQIGDQTEEWKYGPFEDRTSIDERGVHSAHFTVGVPLGTTIPADHWDAFVAEIFTKNAQPYKSYRTLPFFIDGVINNLNFATVDLGDLVYITSADTEFTDEPFRVSEVHSTITSTSWIVELGFTKPDAIASPTTQPDLASSKGAGWTLYAKTSPSASMANVTLEYRITGGLIEWRTTGSTAVAWTVPISGDSPNQNVTTGIPVGMRPEGANWTWTISLGSAGHIAISAAGTMTMYANESRGVAYDIAVGTSLAGQSPAFVLP